MKDMLGLSIPLFDEEAVCEEVVHSLDSALAEAGIPRKLLLVNNGSKDQTSALINRLATQLDSCTALHLSDNAGYGGGILAGMRALNTPILGWYWGDGQVPAQAVVDCYHQLTESGLPLAKARRTSRFDGPQRERISRVYNLLLSALAVGVEDINGCPKLFTREAWERLAPASTDWFLDAEVVLRAVEEDLAWGQADTVMNARQGGSSKVKLSTIAEFAQHLWAWRGGWRP